MRVACLLALHLPIQVERQHNPSLADGPLVVGGRPWDANVVLDCCSQAKAAGVGPGMRLSQAEKLCPTARFVPAREQLYHAAHDALAAAVSYFTPTVETASLGILYAEISGLERRFGSETHLARQMTRETIRISELDVQVGLGSSKFVAEQAARAAQPGKGCVVPPREERTFLWPMATTTLPADPEIQRRLHLLGIRTLGALAALPRLAIVRQFGPYAGPLHDLTCGIDPRPVHPDGPPLALERTCTFNDPLRDRAPLLAHVGKMACTLAESLSHHGYQAEGIRLQLAEENGEKHTASMPVKPPSADQEKLSRLANRLLGTLKPSRPMVALSITIYPLRPFQLGATQLVLFSDTLGAFPGSAKSKRHGQLREALRQLRERFGEMIIIVASLIAPPAPRLIQVTTDPTGRPRALVWHDRIREIRTIYETWRERRYWWSRPVDRDYFRLETDDGQIRVVFHDTRKEQWLLERRRI